MVPTLPSRGRAPVVSRLRDVVLCVGSAPMLLAAAIACGPSGTSEHVQAQPEDGGAPNTVTTEGPVGPVPFELDDDPPSGEGGSMQGTDDEPAAYGGIIGVGQMWTGCPSCLGWDQPVSSHAEALFLEPSHSTSWFDWLPAAGTCVHDPPVEWALEDHRVVGDAVWLTGVHGALPLPLTEGGSYMRRRLGSTVLVPDTVLGLTVAGNGATDAAELPELLSSPDALESVGPEDLFADVQDAWSELHADDASFWWEPVVAGGMVAVEVHALGDPDAETLDVTHCLFEDHGELTVPAAALDGIPTGTPVLVKLYRWSPGGTEHPEDGTIIESFVMRGAIGTATLVR